MVLDTPRYNGHTTAADNLWAGVPVLTHGDSIEMGGRVGASILTTLGLTDLIARNRSEYKKMAVKMGLDESLYLSTRERLVRTCLDGHSSDLKDGNGKAQRPNPYWDLERYVKNLEFGFQVAFFSFLHGIEPQHIRVRDVYDRQSEVKMSCVDSRGDTEECEDTVSDEKWPLASLNSLQSFFSSSKEV